MEEQKNKPLVLRGLGEPSDEANTGAHGGNNSPQEQKNIEKLDTSRFSVPIMQASPQPIRGMINGKNQAEKSGINVHRRLDPSRLNVPGMSAPPNPTDIRSAVEMKKVQDEEGGRAQSKVHGMK